jgi:hypothetical protein
LHSSTALQLLEERVLKFLERFHDRGYVAQMWYGKPDKATFEELDQGILELLQSMDKAVGRNTLVLVKQTYDMVAEVLSEARAGFAGVNEKVDGVNEKLDVLIDQQPAKKDEGYYIRLACEPPPMIVGSHLHFMKAIGALEDEIHASEMITAGQRPICVGDAREVEVTGDILSDATRMRALVWAATGYDVAGIVKPKPLSVAMLQQAIWKSKAPPRVIVVWMAYGAQSAAEELAQATNAEVCGLTILWLKADPHAKQGMRHFVSVVMPAIKRVLDGGSSCEQLTSYLNETLDGDIQAGCLGAQPPATALHWTPASDNSVVKAYPNCKKFNLAEEKTLLKLSGQLLSCDATKCNELTQRLLSDDEESHCLYVCSSNAELAEDDQKRCRAMMVSVCDTLSTSTRFASVTYVR